MKWISERGQSRTDELTPEDVQHGNREWWTKNPMTYDWHGRVAPPTHSRAWFDAIDAQFAHGARLFATRERLCDRIIPFDRIGGKRVLEIGCGMGLHTELMTRAGAEVTAIDLTETGIEATRKRLALTGLEATVRQADAEHLPFDDASFDFVWSWGVIHHSSCTTRIVRQIHRVLRPEGECRIMVYNREGTGAYVTFLKDYLLKGGFRSHTYDEMLFSNTDGFSARYYPKEQFEDLFRGFFHDVESRICGQEADAVPLPRKLRRFALRYIPESYLESAQARRGSFVFLTACRPLGENPPTSA